MRTEGQDNGQKQKRKRDLTQKQRKMTNECIKGKFTAKEDINRKWKSDTEKYVGIKQKQASKVNKRQFILILISSKAGLYRQRKAQTMV